MKKKGYYEYNPVVYPRQLYVMIGATKEDIEKCFDNTGDWSQGDNDDVWATTIPEVTCKADGIHGELVVFKSKSKMNAGTMAHEAFHVLSVMMDLLPLRCEPYGTNEHLAYLLQWIVDCTNKARLGIGNFIELKHETENKK